MKQSYDRVRSRVRTSTGRLLGLLAVAGLALGLLVPTSAQAIVNVVNPWPATPPVISNSNAGTVSGRVVAGVGSNRAMLVAVACEYSANATPAITVSYGGKALTSVLASAGTKMYHVQLFSLNEANLAGASSSTLTVTNSVTTNLTAMYATAAVYAGVDQTTLTTGSATTNTTGATSMALGAYTVAGSAGIPGMSVYVANWNGQTSSPSAGYTEEADYAGANFNLAACYKQITAAGSETPTSTAAASAAGAIVGVGLNPALKMATVATCGDCHSYPPVDSASRNVPIGSNPGSHNRHAGTAAGQYGFTCVQCHYNNTVTSHSTGYKNITGASLPGNAYQYGKKIAITNTPTMGTCSNTKCHSTGRSNLQYNTTPTWGSGTTTCLSCHAGRAGANGAQANSTAGFKLSTTHSQHLKYPAANMNCNICHSKTATDAATLKIYTGTIYHANGTPNVLFTNIAYASYTSYKTATKTCSNTACHGGKTRNAWSNQGTINSDNTCVHCHGSAGTSAALSNTEGNRKYFAPGWGGTGISTDGNTVATDIRVGAHYVHLSSVYIKKIKCNECHTVPSNPFDGTHMATTRYNSQTLTFSQASTAIKNSVSPAFVAGTAATAATCSTTYCHGSSMPKGDTSGSARSPLWNQDLTALTPDAATCGRCHGNPPTFGLSSSAHVGKTATTSCTNCHNTTADATGKTNKANHINGSVDLKVNTAVTTECHSCHGNPPQTLTYGRYSGLAKPKTLALGAAPANAGAHKKHADNGLTCNTCHNNYAATVHPDNKIQIYFRISSATITGWNSASPKAPYGTYSGNLPTGGTPVDTSSVTTLVKGTADSTRNSCSVYCHGGWNGSNSNMNPSWTSGSTATTCGACHGTTALAPPKVGSHARHAGYSSAAPTLRQGYSFACTKCHPSRTASNHIKGTVHLRFSTAVLGTSATYTKTGATQTDSTLPDFSWSTNKLAGDTPDGTCANVYCHSNGRATGMGTAQYNTTANWGTTTRYSCLGCHGGRNGATGAPARSTANFALSTTHSQHLKYPAANMNCNICHSRTVIDAATLKAYTGVKRHVNGKRDVTFASSLAYGTYTSYKSAEVGSSGNTKICSNVSCHGGRTRSAWSATTTNNDNTCVHCHGVAGTSSALANSGDNRKYFAPGWGGTGISTDGNNVNTDIRVGAHFVHLSSVYTKKIKCNECHAVPSNPFDGTHMATPRFNSQTLTFGQASTAVKNSVVPAFVAGTSSVAATCTTTYCHGSSMINGDTAGTDRSPSWNANLTTGTPGTTECARCHGNPPNSVSASHSGKTATTSCVQCHSPVVDATGKIIDKTLHMNGTVETQMACNSCHGYLATDTWNTTFGVEGVGAHVKHINYITNRWGITLNPNTDVFGSGNMASVCGVCHTVTLADHTTGGGGARNINFGGSTARQFGTSAPLYNGVSGTSSAVNPKTCSNIDCHYLISPVWSTY